MNSSQVLTVIHGRLSFRSTCPQISIDNVVGADVIVGMELGGAEILGWSDLDGFDEGLKDTEGVCEGFEEGTREFD